MIKKLIMLSVLLFSVNSFSGVAYTGTLFNFHFMSDGVVIVYTNGSRTDVPSCALSQPSRFALDATTEGGKVQLSGLLSAHATKSPVIIYGSGECATYGGTETISFFYIP